MFSSDDSDSDDLEYDDPNGWKRGSTEDPLASSVNMIRIKNTFITIDEDEETEDEIATRARRKGRPHSCPPRLRRSRIAVARDPEQQAVFGKGFEADVAFERRSGFGTLFEGRNGFVDLTD